MFVIFAKSTRGGKYTIALEMTNEFDAFPGSFGIRETTNGRPTGYANLGVLSAVDAVKEYNRRIDEYAKFDGIHFTKDLRPILDGGVL